MQMAGQHFFHTLPTGSWLSLSLLAPSLPSRDGSDTRYLIKGVGKAEECPRE